MKPVYSLVVFVPREALQPLQTALAEAGAGLIGNYDSFCFVVPGTGFFRPLEGAKPHLGKVGFLEEVAEYRIETVVAEDRLHDVLKAMRDVHPYEEIAFTLIPTVNNQMRHLVPPRFEDPAAEGSDRGH